MSLIFKECSIFCNEMLQRKSNLKSYSVFFYLLISLTVIKKGFCSKVVTGLIG